MIEGLPLDPTANLDYRAELLEWASGNKTRQDELNALCASDISFWLNSFVWLLEPRDNESVEVSESKIPFCAWPHQARNLLEMNKWLGRKDMVLEKGRAEGASWLVLMLFLHKWRYGHRGKTMCRFGVVSKNEDSACNMNDTDSLAWKLKWAVEQLPPWMRPKSWDYKVSDRTLINYDTESGITAYSCADDLGVGGRKLAFMFDELSRFDAGKDHVAWVSNQAVTNCRIAVATPFGPSGKYYELVHDEESDLVHLIFDWKENTSKNRGLYRVVSGTPVLVDITNPFPKGYREELPEILKKLVRKGFDVEAGLRSQWYDKECLRSGATPQSIAQEYDRSFLAQMSRYFGDFLLKRLKVESVRPPYTRGTMSYDPETLAPKFRIDPEGEVLLWVNLLKDGTPPFGKYALGCDISQGTGGSFSSLSAVVVFDVTTGEQVGEFCTRTMRPDKFADWCIAFSKWFHDGRLNWEAPGPGTQFTNQVIYRSYGNVFTRKVKEVMSNKGTKKLGVVVQEDDKVELFGGGGSGYEGFYGAVLDGKAVIRSEKLLDECGEYFFVIRNGRLKVVHESDAKKKGGGDQGKDHGDRVVAAAIAWMTTQDMSKLDDAKPDDSNRVPLNTLAARMKEAEAKEAESQSEVDFN